MAVLHSILHPITLPSLLPSHDRPELHPSSTSPVINGNPTTSPRLCDNNNHEEASENLSPGSRLRRLQEENASLITRLKATEMTLDNIYHHLADWLAEDLKLLGLASRLNLTNCTLTYCGWPSLVNVDFTIMNLSLAII